MCNVSVILLFRSYPPIKTVGKQGGAIAPPWDVLSPMRAAGMLQINTVADPLMIFAGGPTQVHMSPTVAAGKLPINTVGLQGGNIGPPKWGTGGTTGVTNGHKCISVIRAAGSDITSSPLLVQRL
jgi:hypothetical protein